MRFFVYIFVFTLIAPIPHSFAEETSDTTEIENSVSPENNSEGTQFSDEEIAAYAALLTKIEMIQQSRDDNFETSGSAFDQIQDAEKAQEEMLAVINQNELITPERYNSIAATMRNNPDLKARVNALRGIESSENISTPIQNIQEQGTIDKPSDDTDTPSEGSVLTDTNIN